MASRSSYEARSRAVHVRAAIVMLAHDRADVADKKRTRGVLHLGGGEPLGDGRHPSVGHGSADGARTRDEGNDVADPAGCGVLRDQVQPRHVHAMPAAWAAGRRLADVAAGDEEVVLARWVRMGVPWDRQR